MNTPKLIAFDVDGTLTIGNTWERLHAFAGITPEEDTYWFTEHEKGSVTFDAWNNFVISKYHQSGKTQSDFEKVLLDYQFIDHTEPVIQELRKRGYQLALVSGGVDRFVQDVASKLSIPEWYANYHIAYDADSKVIDISRTAEDAQAKVLALQEICRKHHIQPDQIIFVGDSSNDLEAFKFTKRGITVGKGNEKLAEASWVKVSFLNDILHLNELV